MASIRRLTRRLLDQARELELLRGLGEISLILVDDEGIVAVNRACFGKDEPTDVISLSYDRVPGEETPGPAEIFANVERAWKLGRTPEKASYELAFYIAHGLDHLAGAADRTTSQRARMHRREKAWLRDLRKAGELGTLVGP